MGIQYNILIDAVGVLLIVAIYVAERRVKGGGNLYCTRLLHMLMLCCALVFMTDILCLLLSGKEFSTVRGLMWAFHSAHWALQAVYCWLWLLFTDYRMSGMSKTSKKRAFLWALPMALGLTFIVINFFTGWVFTIDDANRYVRGDLYLANSLPYVFYIGAAFVITLKDFFTNTDSAQKRCNIYLAVYIFFIACGAAFDYFYSISWVWPMAALSLLMVYLNVQQQTISEEQLAAARLESELTDGRISIMLSQIQPHFLYNALNTVDALCDVDTKAAQKAVRSFAKYLRGNLDALSRKTTVSFRDELAHLRQYLTLETFRFDNIGVDYDLEALDFMLPPLSLQPIVENAVKYGVLKRRDGGTVTISTRDKKDYTQLTIQDDGVGFDPSEVKSDGRSHIGIGNVRSRLETMCGGTLTVESAPGVGTIVTFIIPKGGTAG